jgi:hypothetical protein
MNFKTAEEYYQYISKQYEANEQVQIDELLEQVPSEFIQNEIFDAIKIYASEQKKHLEKMALREKESFNNKYKLLNDSFIKYSPQKSEPIIISNVWKLDGKQSLTNSIFKHYEETGWEEIEYFMCAWFEEAVEMFNSCQLMVGPCIANSIDPTRLIDNETTNLNSFFDTGKYSSKSVYKDLITEELYQYYNDKLWGGFVWDFITTDAIFEKWSEITRIKETAKNKTKSDILSEAVQDSLKKGWWLSIRLQVLLWMEEYLRELGDESINAICSKHHRASFFDATIQVKQGFQVARPEIISVLHQSLIDNQLIETVEIGLFTQAFTTAEGKIVWCKASNQLGYLIRQMKNKGATLNNDNWKAAENIFVIKGKPVSGNSLKSGAEQITQNNQVLIDGIVENLLSIH